MTVSSSSPSSSSPAGPDRRRIFITGGASGLGLALAHRYAQAGWRVAIGDVNDARLADAAAALRAPAVIALRCDVTSEADLAAAARRLVDEWGGVDVVVNNAGVAIGGALVDVPLDDWRWIVDVNLLGVVRGCKAFTPVLRAQGGGKLVNVASMAGLVHPPYMSAYNATKAAVVAVSETLRVELADDGIDVHVVCPSFFRTNLHESLRAGDPETAKTTHRLLTRAKHGADEIAARVYKGVERGDFHVLPHGDAAAAWVVKRLVPFSLWSSLMAYGARKVHARRDVTASASRPASSPAPSSKATPS